MTAREPGRRPERDVAGAARWPVHPYEPGDTTPGRLRMLARALTRRCLVCGSRGIFTGFFALADRCPRCGFPFEREEGYWVGAMIINIGGAQVAFFAFFLGGLALTWPDPPWAVFLVGGLVLMALFPVVFYPWSKTLWLWGDIAVRGLPDSEE